MVSLLSTQKKEVGKGATYVLGILFAASPDLGGPPEMAGQVDGAALVGLLEQLAAVQSALGDESVVVVAAEVAAGVQTAGDDAHSLELGAAVADGLLVDGEGLREELVRNLLVTRLVRDLAAGDEEAQGEVGSAGDAGVERAEEGVRELVQRRRLRVPIVVEVLACLEFPGELEG